VILSNIMIVIVVGAGGRFGSRLVVALLSYGHQVVAYVRSASKLSDTLPASVISRITVVSGDAEDISSMKEAILQYKVDIVVGCAGSAPWQHPNRLAEITIAVAKAAQQVGELTGKPLRTWLLAGQIVMAVPGYRGKTYLD
jgi:nucleoside-diphosphate-sugar epimerase